jgi:ribonuclease HIII
MIVDDFFGSMLVCVVYVSSRETFQTEIRKEG